MAGQMAELGALQKSFYEMDRIHLGIKVSLDGRSSYRLDMRKR